ncbi:MAG: triose-phosphate isomerase [Cryomorphaceae bacterium]|nr:triose-phosphate isomerase [Cryomorphaceae bacterium]
MSRTKLIAGNWKMNTNFSEAQILCSALKKTIRPSATVEVAVCPPFTHLSIVNTLLNGTQIMLGAQNIHQDKKGAFTGEVSAQMLKDTGVEYVIIGHSERREHFGETNTIVKEKALRCLELGMKPIVCVGEVLSERKSGNYLNIVEEQVREGLSREMDPKKLVVAYEPVWAIGTGETASPEQANEVHGHIRSILTEYFGSESAQEIRIIYGGSMKPSNADELLAQPEVDGGLIGGASLNAEDFCAIVTAGEKQ